MCQDIFTKTPLSQFNVLLFGAVMKRTALALALVSALLFSVLAGTLIVNLAEANPNTLTYVRISIESPQDRVCYNTEPILLNFTAKTNNGKWLSGASYFYFLDGQDYRRESVKVEEIHGFVLDGEYYYEGHVVLSNLSVGQHKLNVFWGYVGSDGLTQVQASSPTVLFSIEQEPFPTTLFAVIVASVAVVNLGLLVVYFKKRNHAKISKHGEMEQPST